MNGDGRIDLAGVNLTSSPYVGETVSTRLNTSTMASSLDIGSVPTATGTDTKLAVDAIAPTVAAPSTAAPSPSKATSLSYAGAFSDSVTGLDASDFAFRKTDGSTAAGTVSGITSGDGGRTYLVTVTGATGEGSVHLDVVANGTISDTAGNRLAAGTSVTSHLSSPSVRSRATT